MKNTALLVVDMQAALVQGAPYRVDTVLQNIAALLAACRKSGVPVIYVQHNGGKGDELEHGTPGWQAASALTPQIGEPTFEKHFNSAFRQTGLHAYLARQGIQHLILVGMQTEYCLDTTCKAAFELGYQITIPQGTVTTFDNAFASAQKLTQYYENCIWQGRFAAVQPMDTVLCAVQNG